jgi:DNA repair exonuclease SbcCD ATPase subunit
MTFLEEQMQKAARLSEEQLEAIRHAAASAREVESRLADEHRRSAQLVDQMEAMRMEALNAANQAAAQIGDLDARLHEELKRAAQLEDQFQAIRTEAINNANQAAARIAGLEARLADEEQKCSHLTERITQLEPIAACVDKFSQALGEIARFSNKPVAA